MSDAASLLHVQVAGRDLLISTQDLREVVASTPVAPLPGGPLGIQGVVLHQGEFLPVLAWADLPGGGAPGGRFAALAVLRPRLGLPIERLLGFVEAAPGAWTAVAEDDPWAPWVAGAFGVGGCPVPLLDPDRLIARLHQLHGDR